VSRVEQEYRWRTVSEPIYRWECTICDAAGVSESPEMARLSVDTHVAVAHADVPEQRPAGPGPEPTT
jgi:hypothetical protein